MRRTLTKMHTTTNLSVSLSVLCVLLLLPDDLKENFEEGVSSLSSKRAISPVASACTPAPVNVNRSEILLHCCCNSKALEKYSRRQRGRRKIFVSVNCLDSSSVRTRKNASVTDLLSCKEYEGQAQVGALIEGVTSPYRKQGVVFKALSVSAPLARATSNIKVGVLSCAEIALTAAACSSCCSHARMAFWT